MTDVLKDTDYTNGCEWQFEYYEETLESVG